MLKVSFLPHLLVIALCFSANLFATSGSSTEPSENVSILGMVGSAVAVSGVLVAGDWIITRITPAHNKVNVTMRSPTQHKKTTITVPAKQLAKTPIATGQRVQVKAVQTGYLLKTQGKTLGVLPNAKGKSLLHSNSYN